MSDWQQVSWCRWVRSDGAVVRWDQRSPWPNPANPRSRMWTAWEPDPSERYIAERRANTTFTWPRRWKTPEAAMKFVDREYPLGVPR